MKRISFLVTLVISNLCVGALIDSDELRYFQQKDPNSIIHHRIISCILDKTLGNDAQLFKKNMQIITAPSKKPHVFIGHVAELNGVMGGVLAFDDQHIWLAMTNTDGSITYLTSESKDRDKHPSFVTRWLKSFGNKPIENRLVERSQFEACLAPPPIAMGKWLGHWANKRGKLTVKKHHERAIEVSALTHHDDQTARINGVFQIKGDGAVANDLHSVCHIELEHVGNALVIRHYNHQCGRFDLEFNGAYWRAP